MSTKTELMTVTQNRLKYLGYYRLLVDGEEGPGIRNAITDFKREHGLRPRPLIGPKTLTAMFSPDARHAPTPMPKILKFISASTSPPWIDEAYRLLGTKEVKGEGNNPIIMDWAESLNQWYPGDDVPWCGLFMAHCMNVGAPDEPQNFNRLRARAWRKYGERSYTRRFCIGVFSRPPNNHNGHVAFILGEGHDYYVILGGNQQDSVGIGKISKDRLLECRVPKEYTAPALPRINLEGAISRNEA